MTKEQLEKDYYKDRPAEPYCDDDSPNDWANIAHYAEENLEKAFERIEALEADIQDLEGIKLAQETALSKEYIIEEQLRKDNTELKEKCAKLEQGYVWHDYDAGEDAYEDSHEGRWVKRDEVEKLEKAKELLKKLTYLLRDADYVTILKDTHLILTEAEQFLKEI